MATTASEGAAQMFSGEARRAAAALRSAVRSARRAVNALSSIGSTTQAEPVPWNTLSVAGWQRQGALCALRTTGSDTVLVTEGRDVAAGVGGRGEPDNSKRVRHPRLQRATNASPSTAGHLRWSAGWRSEV
eukprot:5379381-Pleurochrysis_carterae.AAC.2